MVHTSLSFTLWSFSHSKCYSSSRQREYQQKTPSTIPTSLTQPPRTKRKKRRRKKKRVTRHRTPPNTAPIPPTRVLIWTSLTHLIPESSPTPPPPVLHSRVGVASGCGQGVIVGRAKGHFIVFIFRVFLMVHCDLWVARQSIKATKVITLISIGIII